MGCPPYAFGSVEGAEGGLGGEGGKGGGGRKAC